MTPEMEEMLRQMMEDAAPEDRDSLAQSIEHLRRLPPELQAEAVEQLTKDYEGRETTLRDELENNYALMNKEGPQGMQAGNNPYSVYVAANPLAHAADAYERGMAGRRVKESREGLEALSKSKEKGLGGVAEGMLYETPEEREERRKREAMQAYILRHGSGQVSA